MARSYLQQELKADAPEQLTWLARFDEGPLEGEGPVSVFTFIASIGGSAAESYFVVAGETHPNYYPAWDLAPDEVYNVHIGTRFMLVLEISQLDLKELPPSLENDITVVLQSVAPDQPVEEFHPVAGFILQSRQKHAVCRCHIGDEEVYVLGGDLPVGIYRQVDLPPHVVYRMHLGAIIRREMS
jgi:hypothetical protein